jgi:hypothetical protein
VRFAAESGAEAHALQTLTRGSIAWENREASGVRALQRRFLERLRIFPRRTIHAFRAVQSSAFNVQRSLFGVSRFQSLFQDSDARADAAPGILSSQRKIPLLGSTRL